MRRPSFRLALALAALGGVALLGSKVVKGRASSLPPAPAPSTTWPPLSDATTSASPSTSPSAVGIPSPTGVDEGPVAASPTAAPAPGEDPALSDVVPDVAGTADIAAPATGSTAPPVPPEVATTPPPVPDEPVAPGAPPAAGPSPAQEPSARSSSSAPAAGPAKTKKSAGRASTKRKTDDPTPEPEVVLSDERIDEAVPEQPPVTPGDEGAVPPAPEPTFGTAPDPETAATAPVHVATPVEVEPDEELPVPRRPGTDGPGSSG